MPPRKIPRKSTICTVRGCTKRSVNVDFKNISFHRFPLDVDEASEWVRFSKDTYAEHHFKLAGPIGVRTLSICSQHFEPTCYKAHGDSKSMLKNGALPTLNPPGDEVAEQSLDSEETITDVEMAGTAAGGGGGGKRSGAQTRSNPRRVMDRFFDFLFDDDEEDDDDDDLDLDLREAAKIPKRGQPAAAAPIKRSQPAAAPIKRAAVVVPRKHSLSCFCNQCRMERSEKGIQGFVSTPDKSTQTEERGPQPVASPVPAGANRDCCRLCFSQDQLEPLCSGMIVVRDEMLDKIYLCTGILIIPHPKESIFICTPCAQLINSFHSYRQQVCSNNRALMRFMARLKPAEPSPPVKVRKIPAPPAPHQIKKLPPGVVPILRRVPAPFPPTTKYRKIAPKVHLPVVQPEVPIVVRPSVEIKSEPDDPLEGVGEPAPPVTALPVKRVIKMPAPIVDEVKEETGLLMEAEEGQDDLPSEETWKCWQCENSFLFQFECAKHMLQVHGESVAYIKQRMKLDELNTNMLEMMSMNQRK